MPSPPTEEGSDVPTTENYVQVANEAGQSSSQEVLGGVKVSESPAAAAAAETRPTCCFCMKSWCCSGAHRICCIPCGHVYGRSCLQKWLGVCGNTSAKCPQCSAGFEQKHIINICTPGDMFDGGCSHMQEVETRYSKITEFRARFYELVRQHLSEGELEISKSIPEISEAEASFIAPLSMFVMIVRHHMELLILACQNLDTLVENWAVRCGYAMPSPSTGDGSDVPTTENDVQVANGAEQSSGQGVLGGDRVSAGPAAAAAETRSTCYMCKEPWSCSGAHRICCIPCGHVFGRSCVEKWLGACGNTSAKCPQCGAGFEQKHIITIYTPGDLFDGCSRMQEVEIAEFRARVHELLNLHASERELEISKVTLEIFSKAIASFNELFDHMRMNPSPKFEMLLRYYMELSTLVRQNLDGLGEGNPK